MSYCGSKNPPPGGKRVGTPNECFKKGISVGYAASASGNRKKVTTARVAGEAAATARAKDIKQQRIGKMNLGQLKGIATKLPPGDKIPRYGSMNLEDLKAALVQKGFRL